MRNWILAFLFFTLEVRAWEIDFSRRQVQFNSVNNQNRMPSSDVHETQLGIVDRMVDYSPTAQDIVIMNTENGFVPATVPLRQGGQYKIHIINANAKEKNISFTVDAFSEHHNTLFGKEKSFTVSPRAEGVFSFECPETSSRGQFVVYPESRLPASEKK